MRDGTLGRLQDADSPMTLGPQKLTRPVACEWAAGVFSSALSYCGQVGMCSLLLTELGNIYSVLDWLLPLANVGCSQFFFRPNTWQLACNFWENLRFPMACLS